MATVGDLAGPLAAEPGRAQAEHLGREAAAQLALDRRRRAQRGHLAAIGGRRAGQHHHEQGHQHRPERHRADAGRRARQRAGEQPCLGEHEGGHRQAEQHHYGQVAAGGPRLPQQARIYCSH